MLYRGKVEIQCEIKSWLFLTEVVQSNIYKSRAVGVTTEVGLTTDRDLAETPCLRKRRPLYLRDTGRHVVRATIQQYIYTC